MIVYRIKNMRRIFQMLPLLLLVACAGGKKSDSEEMNFRGDVKSCLERKYTAFMNIEGTAEKGSFEEAVKYEFDEDGNLRNVIWLDSEDDTLKKVVSKFDADGVLVKKCAYDGVGVLTTYSTFKYDEKGRVVETLFYDGFENLTQKELVEYNDENMIETVLLTDEYGKQLKKIVTQRTKEGHPSSVKVYNEEFSCVNNRREEYDEEGRLTYFKVYAPDDVTVLLEVNFVYDKGGNLVKRTAIDENGENFLPETFRYLFDGKSNWTKSANYVGDEVKFLTEREFVYY